MDSVIHPLKRLGPGSSFTITSLSLRIGTDKKQPVSLTEKSSFSKIVLIMMFVWWGLLIVDLTIVSVLFITVFR